MMMRWLIHTPVISNSYQLCFCFTREPSLLLRVNKKISFGSHCFHIILNFCMQHYFQLQLEWNWKYWNIMRKAIPVQCPIWFCKLSMFGKVVENIKEILDAKATNILGLVSKTDPKKSLSISAFHIAQNALHVLCFKINDQSSDKTNHYI